MEATCKDIVFGEMSYKHRWYKQQTISMFGKEWTITVAAKAIQESLLLLVNKMHTKILWKMKTK